LKIKTFIIITNQKQNKDYHHEDPEIGITTSNEAVPLFDGRPSTILPDGEVKSSKSPYNAASEINDAVVSKEAFSNGELFVEIPFRLNGLYPPSNVWKV